MANTIRPDRELQRFNVAKENLGNYFRFTKRSAFFNIVFMGLVPAGLALVAYNNEGQWSFSRRFRKSTVLSGEEYQPRDKDL